MTYIFKLQRQTFRGEHAERASELFCDALERRGLRLVDDDGAAGVPKGRYLHSTMPDGLIVVEWRHDGRAAKGLRKLANNLMMQNAEPESPPLPPPPPPEQRPKIVFDRIETDEGVDFEPRVVYPIAATHAEPPAPIEVPVPPAVTELSDYASWRLNELVKCRAELEEGIVQIDKLIGAYALVSEDLQRKEKNDGESRPDPRRARDSANGDRPRNGGTERDEYRTAAAPCAR